LHEQLEDAFHHCIPCIITFMKSFLEMFRTNGKSYALTFALVCTLFFLWGFCNGMIELLNKQFKNSLHINNMESFFVQFANFISYFLMAIPSGLLAKRFGYKGGILMGLGLVALGAIWFIPATLIDTYAVFLTGLFVIAAGLTILETIANPYTTVLGPSISGATRINLAQTCNAVGTWLGPIIGGTLLLSSTGVSNTSNSALYIPYLVVAALVIVLFVLFVRSELPDLQAEDDAKMAASGSLAVASKPLLSRWHFTLAIGAQFFYVAAQVGIWGTFANYVTSSDMPVIPQWIASHLYKEWTFAIGSGYHVTDLGSSRALSGGILLFIAGRFFGSMVLRVCSAHLTLAVFGLVNSILMALIILHLGWVSVVGLFLSNFFMSIMYPTIFALGIRGLGEHTKFGSSLIVMAIVGGAVLPLAMGWLADRFSMHASFTVPLICFVYVMLYAAFWPALERLDTGHDVQD
jgi:FHS family L-fucose permease-like MFS transporter